MASYFKRSPAPYLGPEFRCARLITVVFTFSVPHLFQAKRKKKTLASLSSDEVIVILPCPLLCAVSTVAICHPKCTPVTFHFFNFFYSHAKEQ